MANISAADVKKLRDATGAGMMDCKKALTEADGDYAKAVEVLRIKGQARAEKRSGERQTSNGLVVGSGNSMIELACETDYVAKNQQFQDVAAQIVEAFAGSTATDVPSANEVVLADGRTVATAILDLAAVIGEKLELGRVAKLEIRDGESVASYLHKKAADLPAQVGVLVRFTTSGDGSAPDDAAAAEQVAAARGAAMQVAALRARYLTRDEVPADTIETEKRVAEAKAIKDNKPAAALPKIIEGTVNSFFKDNVLLEQSSVQDSKKTVKAMLDAAGVTLTGFAHIEVGQA